MSLVVQSEQKALVEEPFFVVNLGYLRLHIIESKCSYAYDLSCPNWKRLEVSENVKEIDLQLQGLQNYQSSKFGNSGV